MYLGPRRPSLTGKIAARTSLKRIIRHNLGLKAPRGYGWLTNPRRAAYNRVYYRKNKAWASGGPGLLLLALIVIAIKFLIATWFIWVTVLAVAAAVWVARTVVRVKAEAAAEAEARERHQRDAAEALEAELHALELRFQSVAREALPAQDGEVPAGDYARVALDSGEICYLGHSPQRGIVEVLTRRRRSGDPRGTYSGPYGHWSFDLSQRRWTTNSAPPAARELRARIDEMLRLEELRNEMRVWDVG